MIWIPISILLVFQLIMWFVTIENCNEIWKLQGKPIPKEERETDND